MLVFLFLNKGFWCGLWLLSMEPGGGAVGRNKAVISVVCFPEVVGGGERVDMNLPFWSLSFCLPLLASMHGYL